MSKGEFQLRRWGNGRRVSAIALGEGPVIWGVVLSVSLFWPDSADVRISATAITAAAATVGYCGGSSWLGGGDG